MQLGLLQPLGYPLPFETQTFFLPNLICSIRNARLDTLNHPLWGEVSVITFARQHAQPPSDQHVLKNLGTS